MRSVNSGGLTDEAREEAIRRMRESLELDGDRRVDLNPIYDAAAQAPPLSNKKIELTRRYAASLSEPQRTMFAEYLNGKSATQIAESMGLKPKAVAKSLAKVYVSLHALLNHKETAV